MGLDAEEELVCVLQAGRAVERGTPADTEVLGVGEARTSYRNNEGIKIINK